MYARGVIPMPTLLGSNISENTFTGRSSMGIDGKKDNAVG
jgi:hypothetical protein